MAPLADSSDSQSLALPSSQSLLSDTRSDNMTPALVSEPYLASSRSSTPSLGLLSIFMREDSIPLSISSRLMSGKLKLLPVQQIAISIFKTNCDGLHTVC